MPDNLLPVGDDLVMKGGTIGGTLITLMIQLPFADILNTAICAGISAAVSFTISWLLQVLVRKRQKNKSRFKSC